MILMIPIAFILIYISILIIRYGRKRVKYMSNFLTRPSFLNKAESEVAVNNEVYEMLNKIKEI